MRRVRVAAPSFPAAPPNAPLDPKAGALWQVLCGDEGHWRLGMFSPAATRAEDLEELERHTCPELFVLLSGRVVLLLAESGRLRSLELEAGRPVLVAAPHGGFCPDGAHRGVALVVERDAFETEYRATGEWLRDGGASQG